MPVWIHLKKKEPFPCAGLWDLWRDPEGQTLYTFTIITTVPNALLRPIHNRMPVIFDRLSAKQWLDPAFWPNEATLAAVLAPYPSELMEAHEVSSLVNKSEYDRADCLKRVVERQFRLV
jgi:putative SOS response-associated peptidase YedK